MGTLLGTTVLVSLASLCDGLMGLCNMLDTADDEWVRARCSSSNAPPPMPGLPPWAGEIGTMRHALGLGGSPRIERAEGPFQVCLMGVDRWPCASDVMPRLPRLVSGIKSKMIAAVLHDGVLMNASSSSSYAAKLRLDGTVWDGVVSGNNADMTRVTYFIELGRSAIEDGFVAMDTWVERDGVFVEGSYTMRSVAVRSASWSARGGSGDGMVLGAAVLGGHVRIPPPRPPSECASLRLHRLLRRPRGLRFVGILLADR